jgi:hypothetical protein
LLPWRDSPLSRKDLSPSRRENQLATKHDNNSVYASVSAIIHASWQRGYPFNGILNCIVVGHNSVSLRYFMQCWE